MIASAAAGLAEAGVLALVAYIAAAMSEASHNVLAIGPITVQSSVGALLLVAASLACARLVLQLAIAYLPARLSAEVQMRLRLQIFDAYIEASWSEKAAQKEGHLQELMGTHVNHAGAAVLHLASLLTTGLTFAMLVLSALVLSIPVALGIMLAAAFLFSALRPLSRRVRRLAASTSEASLDQAAQIAESSRLAQEVEVFGVDDAARDRVGAAAAVLQERFARTRALARVTPTLYQSSVMLLLISGLALLYILETANLASLGAVVLMLVRSSAYGQQMQTAYQGLVEASPYLERVASSAEQLRARARIEGSVNLGKLRQLELDGVWFSYLPDVPVLKDVSVAINAGETIGIVGPSGAGKSTLVQILLGLRAPEAGSYRVNGVAVEEIRRDEWTKRIAYVPQDPAILTGTVGDNIRFYRDWIDDKAVERAAQLAHIHHDIETWSLGYRAGIGARSDAVSGGQKQRLCIARALAGAPDVLILDEPTSALDLQSERLIQQSLKQLRREVTLIVVAHRLSTLNTCDRIIVLNEGRVEAFAPAAELESSNEFFRRAASLAASLP